jgi:hypothetical protein
MIYDLDDEIYNTIIDYEEKHISISRYIERYIYNKFKVHIYIKNKFKLLKEVSLFHKTRFMNQVNNIVETWQNTDDIYFIVNIISLRKDICQEIMNVFGLTFAEDYNDYKTCSYTFKVNKNDFNVVFGLIRILGNNE